MRKHYLAKEDGFTLVEMIVVTAIFIVVIIITSIAFNTVLTQTKKVSKSEESNIEGVIGLEMFRHDLEQAGFGLFNEIDNPPPVYAEAVGVPALTNDSPSGIPRAFVAINNVTGDPGILDNTDYLAIKATTVSRELVSQKWTYINGVGSSKVWGVNDFDSTYTKSEFVVAMRQNYKNNELHRKLIYNLSDTDSFSVRYRNTAVTYSDPFGPPSDAVQYYYYGIDSSNPIAPFNRTDYFVKRTSTTPTNCAPGAGVLYKSTMSQVDGSMTDIPVLDCVADMQVVFGWNTNEPAGPASDIYTNADMTSVSTPIAWTPSLDDPLVIGKHLKLIKIYLLVQDGGKDMKYINTETQMPVGVVGEANALADTRDLTGPNYQNYRWKLYRIVVKPKNLI